MLPTQLPVSSQSIFAYSSNPSTSLFDPNTLAFDPSMAGLGNLTQYSMTTNYLGSSSTSVLEPNSPELFMQNVKVALLHAEYLRRRIEGCMACIQQAYYAPGNSHQALADMKSLREEVEAFVNHLVSSGVGALPALYTTPLEMFLHDKPRHKDEKELLAEMSSAVNVLYAKQKQIQDNNAVVANLLSVSEGQKK